MGKKLYKSKKDKKLTGVCGGLAELFNIDSSTVRVLWAIFSFFGAGVIVYIILALALPSAPDNAVAEDSNQDKSAEQQSTDAVVNSTPINNSNDKQNENFSGERVANAQTSGIAKIQKTKKKAWTLIAIAAVVLVIELILVIINEKRESSVITTFLFILSLVAIALIIVAVAQFIQANDMKMRTCLKCGENISYDDVGYEQISSRTTDNANYITVEFTVHCPNCGEERTFTKEYTTARIDKDGNVQRVNVEAQIRKIYKG